MNYVTGNGTLQGDLICYGELEIQENSTLHVQGNLYQENNHTVLGQLIITGDYIAETESLSIDNAGRVTIHGDLKIKKDAGLKMIGQDSCLTINGNMKTASQASLKNSLSAGTLKLKGNLLRTKSAVSDSINMPGTKLVLSGNKKQEITLQSGGNIYQKQIDLTRSTEVEFTDGWLYTGGIKGWDKISNPLINLRESRLILEQDEQYSGSLIMVGEYLDCNGYSFQLAGDLEVFDTVCNLNGGTLDVGGSYLLHGTSILQMKKAEDLLKVHGSLLMSSSLSYVTMLTNGRFELWGDFRQEYNGASFACTSPFTMAFMGDGSQKVHFENVQQSYFADIDPDHKSYIKDYTFAEIYCWVTKCIGEGITEGIGEMLESPEELVAGFAAAMAAALGLTAGSAVIAVSTVVVLGILTAVMTLGIIRRVMTEWSDASSRYDKVKLITKELTIVGIQAAVAKGGEKAAAGIQSTLKDLSFWKKCGESIEGEEYQSVLEGTADALGKKTAREEAAKSVIANFETIFNKISEYMEEDALEYIKTDFEKYNLEAKDAAGVIKKSSEAVQRKISKSEVRNIFEELADGTEGEVILNRFTSGSKTLQNQIQDIKTKMPQQLLAEGWQDVTDSRMAANTTSREFLDPKTGLKIRFDQGVEGATGFEAVDHYHIYNSNYTNKKLDYYYDLNGNPVGKGSNASHIVIGGDD